jgi:hypothetical protein
MTTHDLADGLGNVSAIDGDGQKVYHTSFFTGDVKVLFRHRRKRLNEPRIVLCTDE